MATACNLCAISIRPVLSCRAAARLLSPTYHGPLSYVAICFLFHPIIGIAAVIGGVVLALITLCAELFTRAPTKAAAAYQATRNALLEASRRNAEVVRAMGVAPRLARVGGSQCQSSEKPKKGVRRVGRP